MQDKAPIYLDYAATTPLDKEILSKMMMVSTHYGNPSSIHKLGKNAKSRLERARALVADNIGAELDEIIFTSGATESNNTILNSVIEESELPHIITTRLEHKSILETLEQDKNRVDYSFVETNEDGIIDLKELKAEITENTKLVSIHFVNNETGTIQPIKEIAEFLKEENIPLHIDAAQALGHVPLNVKELDVDYMSISGHKIGAPKGIGILYVRKNSKLNALLFGGSQERGRRAGTENLIYAHAISIAVRKAARDFEERHNKEFELKDLFKKLLSESGVPYELNESSQTSPHIINLYFPWVKTDIMLMRLDLEDIYVSGGSACNAGTIQPSHVISALYGEDRASHSIRFSLSYMTTEDEIVRTVETIKNIYESLK